MQAAGKGSMRTHQLPEEPGLGGTAQPAQDGIGGFGGKGEEEGAEHKFDHGLANKAKETFFSILYGIL